MTASGDFLRVDPGDKFKAVGLKAGLVEKLLFTTTEALPGSTEDITLAEGDFFDDYTHISVEIGGVKTSVTSTIPSVRALTRQIPTSWSRLDGAEETGHTMTLTGLNGTGITTPALFGSTGSIVHVAYDVDERNYGIMRVWGLRPGLIAGESGTTASSVSTTARFATNGILGIGADGTFTARRLAIRPKHEQLYNSSTDQSISNNPAVRNRGAQTGFTLASTTHLEDYHDIYFTLNDYNTNASPINFEISTEMTYGRQIRRAGEWTNIANLPGVAATSGRKPTGRTGNDAVHPLLIRGGLGYMFVRSDRDVGSSTGGDRLTFDFTGSLRRQDSGSPTTDFRVRRMYGIRYELVDLDG